MSVCRICKKPDCDDDCEELAAIYREHQKEQLADIDITGLAECWTCGCPVDKGYCLCFSCENGIGED